jgi:hypothetical protein
MPAKPRKKWKVTYRGTDTSDTFTSEKATYEWLRDLARTYFANPASVHPRATVWVDEGRSRGWERFDVQDVSEWTDYAPEGK